MSFVLFVRSSFPFFKLAVLLELLFDVCFRPSFPSPKLALLELLFDECLGERAVCVPFPFEVSLYSPIPAFETFAFLDLDPASLTKIWDFDSGNDE